MAPCRWVPIASSTRRASRSGTLNRLAARHELQFKQVGLGRRIGGSRVDCDGGNRAQCVFTCMAPCGERQAGCSVRRGSHLQPYGGNRLVLHDRVLVRHPHQRKRTRVRNLDPQERASVALRRALGLTIIDRARGPTPGVWCGQIRSSKSVGRTRIQIVTAGQAAVALPGASLPDGHGR